MCSYITEKVAVTGSGKGPSGWFQLSHATVYVDHPYFTPMEHTLNIDFINQAAGPSARVAVELSPDSARELVARIQTALRAAEESASDQRQEVRDKQNPSSSISALQEAAPIQR